MYQKLIFCGYAGKDAKLFTTPDGKTYTRFTVASHSHIPTKEPVNGKNFIKKTTWFDCVAWGRLAEICSQYINKGRAVLIEGEVLSNEFGRPRVWETNDGKHMANHDVLVQQMKLVGRGNSYDGVYNADEEDIPDNPHAPDDIDEVQSQTEEYEDIPF